MEGWFLGPELGRAEAARAAATMGSLDVLVLAEPSMVVATDLCGCRHKRVLDNPLCRHAAQRHLAHHPERTKTNLQQPGGIHQSPVSECGVPAKRPPCPGSTCLYHLEQIPILLIQIDRASHGGYETKGQHLVAHGRQPGASPVSRDLGITPDLLLANRGVVLEGQAMRAEGLDDLLNPGPSLHRHRAPLHVDVHDLVQQSHANHALWLERETVGGQGGPNDPDLAAGLVRLLDQVLQCSSARDTSAHGKPSSLQIAAIQMAESSPRAPPASQAGTASSPSRASQTSW